jgi:hypothetical protein
MKREFVAHRPAFKRIAKGSSSDSRKVIPGDLDNKNGNYLGKTIFFSSRIL